MNYIFIYITLNQVNSFKNQIRSGRAGESLQLNEAWNYLSMQSLVNAWEDMLDKSEGGERSVMRSKYRKGRLLLQGRVQLCWESAPNHVKRWAPKKRYLGTIWRECVKLGVNQANIVVCLHTMGEIDEDNSTYSAHVCCSCHTICRSRWLNHCFL